MEDWLANLVNPAFMPHGHCYLWRPDILWTHVIADTLIGLSYMAIPVVLGVFYLKRKKQIMYPGIVGLFCAFILLCGFTHFFEIVVTWHPLYEYEGWLKAATAVVSAFTAALLVPLLPELLSLPDIKKAYSEANKNLNELKEKNQELQSFYEVALDREERILTLKQEVNKLLKEQGMAERYSTK